MGLKCNTNNLFYATSHRLVSELPMSRQPTERVRRSDFVHPSPSQSSTKPSASAWNKCTFSYQSLVLVGDSKLDAQPLEQLRVFDVFDHSQTIVNQIAYKQHFLRRDRLGLSSQQPFPENSSGQRQSRSRKGSHPEPLIIPRQFAGLV